MDNYDEELANVIRVKIGVATGYPGRAELKAIKNHMKGLIERGIEPSHNNWYRTVRSYCPPDPLSVTDGEDNVFGSDSSDLNNALMLALNMVTPKEYFTK